ncbi:MULTISPECIES: serine aminopeptidase domain-containing protein [unclassified Kribbella]|uniref:alpha/beta hydrolase n=1 Tax=unclassified Kribbella TaxID=2644121 RepID=UPI0033C7B07F
MQTPEATYDDLIDRVDVFYQQGSHREALAVLDEADDSVLPWLAELTHTRACLLGVLGRPEEGLAALQSAAAAGAWWDDSLLTEDDDLASLQELPGFAELREVSRTQRTATPPAAPILQLPDGAAQGVVVALHGAGQRATRAARDWASVTALGYALLCVESSQQMSPMYRTWPSPEQSRDDVSSGLATMPADLQSLPLIAAGFSAGGRVALDWALTGQPQSVAGVVVLAPALRQLPEAARGPLEPAVVLMGTDDDLREVVEGDRLTAFGVAVEWLPGVGHEFPADFAERLAQVFRK